VNIISDDDQLFIDDLDDYGIDDAEEEPRFSLITKLVILLLILTMLATLVWPLLRAGPRRQPTPTPTPLFLQEA
jgi:hypothetical protein